MKAIKSIIICVLSLAATSRASELNPKGLHQLEQYNNCGINKDAKSTLDTDLKRGSRPWMAVFNNLPQGRLYLCTGTLISDQFVLTAAHCVVNAVIESVSLGDHNLLTAENCTESKETICLPNVESFSIEGIFVHDYFTDDIPSDDLALVKLDKKVIFSEFISPICLPVNATLPQDVNSLATLHLTGWGTNGSGVFDYQLREVIVSNAINAPAACAKAARITVDNDELCVFNRTAICPGASGNPLSQLVEYSGVERYVLFGMVTRGRRDVCTPFFCPKIANYMPWITDVLAGRAIKHLSL